MIKANEYTWPGEEYVIDEDFHGDSDEKLLHDLVADDILDLYANFNNSNMEGGRQGAGQQGPQRMVVVDPMRNLLTFSGEKTESADSHLDTFENYLVLCNIK